VTTDVRRTTHDDPCLLNHTFVHCCSIFTNDDMEPSFALPAASYVKSNSSKLMIVMIVDRLIFRSSRHFGGRPKTASAATAVATAVARYDLIAYRVYLYSPIDRSLFVQVRLLIIANRDWKRASATRLSLDRHIARMRLFLSPPYFFTLLHASYRTLSRPRSLARPVHLSLLDRQRSASFADGPSDARVIRRSYAEDH